MAYTRPGVFVTESPLQTKVARRNTTAIAAFLGTSGRGPETPTLIDSWTGYKALFGDLDQSHDMGFALYHYFANGGRVAYVSRVVGSGATTAESDSVTYIANSQGAGSVPASLFTVSAKSTGTWGNSLTVTLSGGKVTASATELPTMNLSIKLNGSEVELWSGLSVESSNSRFIESVINNYSSYITISDVAAVTANENFSFFLNPVSLTGGTNGIAVASADYIAALQNLNDVDGSLIINCVGQYDSTVVNAATAYAEERGNSFVVIDPDPSSTTSAAAKSTVGAYNPSSYGAVYYPMLKMVDPSKTGPAAVRTTFPGGAVVGAYVRTDNDRTVAKTPAGYAVDIRNALGLATTVNDSFISSVYDSGINCLKAIPGAGVVILGGRTLKLVAPDMYISVRRSLNYVKQGASDLTAPSVFEPNGPQLWSAIQTRITQFLTTFWGAGGLKGRSTAEAFYVVCDETNNTATTIDNGEVHVQIGLALQYPAEFIVINVSRWVGGSNTSETL